MSNSNTAENTPVLQVENLKVSFSSEENTVVAVNGISYQLNKGETLGIVGESGSGKSVSCMSLLKLVPTPPGKYDAGIVRFNGGEANLLEMSESEIRQYRGAEIAMIFQEPMTSLNPSHRCGKQVAEMLRLHTDWDKKQIDDYVLELFEKVQLPDPKRIYTSYPHQLSGGQLQRVMIAMAISCKPKILIADEPTTALDVTVQKTIIELLKDLNEINGNSTIFITHDLGVINQIADSVMVMYQGEVKEYGPTKEIFNNPKHPYTKGLLACRPPLNKRFRRLPIVGDFLSMPVSEHQAYVNALIEPVANFKQRLTDLEQKEVILEAKNIKKYYPSKTNFFGKPTAFVKAVDDVSFSLRKGEIIGLVGESGCGKSTLGRVLLCLDKATSGSVVFEGKDLFSMDKSSLRKLRKDFQIIFQDPYSSLNPRMTVGEAIMEPLKVHNLYKDKQERKEKVIDLLEKVGMKADHYNRYPHQFSGGQRQRICVARSLSLNPKFILCDESVSALDVSVQAQVLNLLQDLKDEFDLSYIFISHDLSVIKFIADHVLVMQKGKIVERGDVESVINNPQNPYTKMLIDSIPQ
ncbi:MAG: ABC transporter ATP-binding protein [Saprospiraceae bacterium]|nr:ABC transporter ATP-binding protein [Saprospiraceae bacterium]